MEVTLNMWELRSQPPRSHRTETLTQMREVPKDAESPLSPSSSPAPAASPLRPWLNILPEVLALCLCVVLWVSTREFRSSVGGPGPAMYPRTLITLFAIAMVVRMVQQVREERAGRAGGAAEHEAPPEEGVEFDESLIESRKVWVAIGFSVLYVLSTLYLGWLIATFLFTLGFLVLAGKRNPLFIVPTAFVFAFGFAYVFVKIVYISLPTGVGVFDSTTARLFELMGIY